jgi:hypothetical protein
MSASTEQGLRQHAAGWKERPPSSRSPAMLDPAEAASIARGLIAKYGPEAVAFGEGRAGRAREIGDDLALAAWSAVIAETRFLLSSMAEA